MIIYFLHYREIKVCSAWIPLMRLELARTFRTAERTDPERISTQAQMLFTVTPRISILMTFWR